MFQRLKQLVMDMSTANKIFCCFSFIILLLISSVTYFSYMVASDIVMQKMVTQSEETIQQVSDNIDNHLRLINDKLSALAFNSTVQQELSCSGTQQAEGYYSATRIIRRQLVQTYSSFNMQDLEIYGDNGKSYYISILSTKRELVNEKQFLNMAVENKGEIITINDINDSGFIQVVKQIKDLLTLKPLGVLRASVRPSSIEKLTQNIDFAYEGSVIVLDENNQRILGNKSIIFKHMKSLFPNWEDSFQYEMNGHDYMVIYKLSSYTGWKTIGVVPLDSLKGEMMPLRYSFLFISGAIFIVSILLTRLFARSIVNPIKDMTAALKTFSKGDFSVRLPENRNDEFGQMSKVFNRTIQKMNYLVEKDLHRQILEKELEFKALQAQINPHFLYNTLDTINWMARKEGKYEICDIISAISNLMRISISNKQRIITVEKEINYIKDYLFIQKIRYRDRFSPDIQIDDKILYQMIPKLTLQPIVENAIVHGIEESKEHCILSVIGELKGNNIQFVIEDTGIGIPASKVQDLLKKPDNTKESNNFTHTNLGLYAVNQIIKYIYGDNYGLTISSEEGKWTRIMVLIPYLDNPETLIYQYNEIMKGD